MHSTDYPSHIKTTYEPLEPEAVQTIKVALLAKYARDLKPGEDIVLYSQANETSALVKAIVGTELRGEVFHVHCEGISDGQKKQAVDYCVDFLDHALSEYFSNDRDARLPIDFTEFKVWGQKVLARQQFHDFDLEAQADALLAE